MKKQIISLLETLEHTSSLLSENSKWYSVEFSDDVQAARQELGLFSAIISNYLIDRRSSDTWNEITVEPLVAEVFNSVSGLSHRIDSDNIAGLVELIHSFNVELREEEEEIKVPYGLHGLHRLSTGELVGQLGASEFLLGERNEAVSPSFQKIERVSVDELLFVGKSGTTQTYFDWDLENVYIEGSSDRAYGVGISLIMGGVGDLMTSPKYADRYNRKIGLCSLKAAKSLLEGAGYDFVEGLYDAMDALDEMYKNKGARHHHPFVGQERYENDRFFGGQYLKKEKAQEKFIEEVLDHFGMLDYEQ